MATNVSGSDATIDRATERLATALSKIKGCEARLRGLVGEKPAFSFNSVEVILEAKISIVGDRIDLSEGTGDAIDEIEQEIRRVLNKSNWKLISVDWGDEASFEHEFSFELLTRKNEVIANGAIRELVTALRRNYEILMRNLPYQITHIAVYPIELQK